MSAAPSVSIRRYQPSDHDAVIDMLRREWLDDTLDRAKAMTYDVVTNWRLWLSTVGAGAVIGAASGFAVPLLLNNSTTYRKSTTTNTSGGGYGNFSWFAAGIGHLVGQAAATGALLYVPYHLIYGVAGKAIAGVEKIIDDPDVHTFVAVVASSSSSSSRPSGGAETTADVVVGATATLQSAKFTWSGNPTPEFDFEVVRLYVDPKFRGCGLLGKLIDALMEDAELEAKKKKPPHDYYQEGTTTAKDPSAEFKVGVGTSTLANCDAVVRVFKKRGFSHSMREFTIFPLFRGMVVHNLLKTIPSH